MNQSNNDRISPPKCFISYAWGSKEHQKWVKKFADDLIKKGIDIILDIYEIPSQITNLREFMEKGVSESDYTLIICTPQYKEKTEKKVGALYYEHNIITSLFQKESQQKNRSKFVPVLKEGSPEDSIPLYLTQEFYYDFRNSHEYTRKLNDLIGFMNEKQPNTKPSIKSVDKHVQKAPSRAYYTYIIECMDEFDSIDYYIGYTQDLKKSFDRHVSNKGPIFTKNKDLTMVAIQTFMTKKEAMEEKNRMSSWNSEKLKNYLAER